MDLSFKENFINTREAGEYSGYTADYIARLIRSGKIAGQKIGHSWFVNKDSLNLFFSDKYKQQQKNTKVTNISEIQAPAVAHAQKIGDKIQYSSSVTRLSSSRGVLEGELFNRFFAFSVAVVVVALGAFGAQVIASSHVADRVATIAKQTAEGFTIAFGALPAQVIAKISATEATEYAITSIAVVSSLKLKHSFDSFSPMKVVSPQSFSVEDHTTAYEAFFATASAPRVTTRSSLAVASFFADMVIALGYGATSLAHFAIGADVSFAYGVVTVAPQTAHMVTVLSMSLGTFLMGNVASLPTLASGVYRNMTAAPAILAPALAEGLLRGEYVGMSSVVAFVGGLPLSTVIDVSRATYVGAGRALASVQVAVDRTFGFATLRTQ